MYIDEGTNKLFLKSNQIKISYNLSSSKKVVAAFGREQSSLITWYPFNYVKCVQGQFENSLSCVNYHMQCENGS
jgi:hypothetical protein